MQSHDLRQVRRAFLVAFCTLAVASALGQQAQTEMALVADSADGGGPAGGTFFMVTEAVGVAIENTAWSASARASFGRGAHMVIVQASRMVPAGSKVSLKLRGLQAHVAPIDTIFRAIFKGGNPEVLGTVEVELTPLARYRANGVMDAMRREIWLEDEKGVVVPGSKVAAPVDPNMLKAMEGASYVTSNLRYEDDWISESPFHNLPYVPIGARLKVSDYGSNRASVLIDGRKMRMGVDWSRGTETVQQFVARVTSSEDPRPKLASFPERVRTAIRAGRVFPGMSRDHVVMALGRPRLDLVPNLDAFEWKYITGEREEMFLIFSEAGTLKEVDASRKVRGLVLYEGP